MPINENESIVFRIQSVKLRESVTLVMRRTMYPMNTGFRSGSKLEYEEIQEFAMRNA